MGSFEPQEQSENDEMNRLSTSHHERDWKRCKATLAMLHKLDSSPKVDETLAAIYMNTGVPIARLLRDAVVDHYSDWPVILDGFHFRGFVDQKKQDWSLTIRGNDNLPVVIFDRLAIAHMASRGQLYIDTDWLAQEDVILSLRKTFWWTFWLFPYPAHRRGPTVGWLGYVWAAHKDWLGVAQQGGGYYPITGWWSLLKARFDRKLAHPAT